MTTSHGRSSRFGFLQMLEAEQRQRHRHRTKHGGDKEPPPSTTKPRQQPRKTQPSPRSIAREVEAKVGWKPEALITPYAQLVRVHKIGPADVVPGPGGTWVDLVGRDDTVVRRQFGLLRYVGPVHFANGTWAGMELPGAHVRGNTNDGSVDGVRYFTCATPGHQGLLMEATWVRKSFVQKPLVPVSRRGEAGPTTCTIFQPAAVFPPHNHVAPTVYEDLHGLLQLLPTATSHAALDDVAGIVYDMANVTTLAEQEKKEKAARERRERAAREREARHRQVQAAQPLKDLAITAAHALRASTPRPTSGSNTNRSRPPPPSVSGARTAALTRTGTAEAPSTRRTSTAATTTTTEGRQRTARSLRDAASSPSAGRRPSYPEEEEEEKEPPALSPPARTTMNVQLPQLSARQHHGPAQAQHPKSRVLGEVYVLPSFQRTSTATTTHSRSTSASAAARNEGQRRDDELEKGTRVVDLVEASRRLLGATSTTTRQAHSPPSTSLASFFEGAQRYLEEQQEAVPSGLQYLRERWPAGEERQGNL